MLGAMAAAIKIYKGGVLLITHNSEFSQTVCPETWFCPGNGKLEISGADWMIAAEKARAAAEKKAKLLEGFDADKEELWELMGKRRSLLSATRHRPPTRWTCTQKEGAGTSV